MNKTVILLNNGFGHIEALSLALKQRGKHVTALAQKGCSISPAACDDMVYCEDIYCVDDVFRRVEDISTKIDIEFIANNSAALTFIYQGLLKKFGDPFGHSNWLLNAHVKAECRRILNQKGISKVKYSVIKNATELEQVKQDINYPAVIKPIMGQGSECVFKIYNAEELAARYEQIRDVLVKGIIRNGDYNIVLNGNRYNVASDVMIEKYIEGDEFTVDGYIENGNAVVVAVHQKFFGIEENGFRDRFYVTPPKSWGRADQLELEEVIKATSSALDMNDTLFHIEMRKSSDGFKIIEVNPRLGGGTIQENVLLATGVSLIDVYADILCRRPVTANIKRVGKVVYDFGLTMPKSGKVLQIDGLDELRSMKAVSNVQLNIKPGDVVERVMGEKFVLFCNGAVDSHADAFELFRHVSNMIKVKVI